MATVTIKGVPVKFPFTPYEIQTNYMEKVIDCLENRQNGLLESPTGTGKTLSLLCASLAWLEIKKTQFADAQWNSDGTCSEEDEDSSQSKQVPRIIYASRTHSQLHQAMQEMKRTAYSHMRACVLGSRDQMCVNEEVMEVKDKSVKINMCLTKVKNKSCGYYNGVQEQKIDKMMIVDMEDMIELGKCHKFCPYFMARRLELKSDIVFMPYNYLLDPRTTKGFGLKFHNCIVILDEAHNIEKVCEDAASTQINTNNITSCIEDITAIIDALKGPISHEEEIEFTLQQLIHLNEIFIKFKKVLNDIQLPVLCKEGVSFNGDYIFEMLEKAGAVHRNFNNIVDLLEKITQFLSTTSLVQRSVYDLNIFSDLLNIVSYSSKPEFKEKIKECFKVHIVDEEPKRSFGSDWLSQTQIKEKYRVLNFWCFSPGFAMNMLMDQEVHCVILTSGSLAPLKPLISELEINVGVKIENPHIVKGDQICVKVLTRGPDMEPLISNFKNRNNPKYVHSLGLVISNLVRVIPHGVLIFFPSYVTMATCKQYWEEHGIWNMINQIKPIYVEPKDKISFKNAMNDYYLKIKDPNYEGAIFMGVCRGKVSEGLDFADINGRAVFITGLPYPPVKEPKVIFKKKYLDYRNSKNRENLRGDEWYSLEATRAINQAIGRVIRHKDDYGAIILLDSRFTDPRVKSNMSHWLQSHIDDMKNFGEIIRHVRQFFNNAKENLPPPKIKENIQQLQEMDLDLLYTTNSTENVDFGLVTIHKRKDEDALNSSRKKIK